MSLTVRVLFVVTLLLSIVIPFGYFLIGQRTKKRYKRAIGTNVFFFFSTVLIAGIMLFARHTLAIQHTDLESSSVPTDIMRTI